MKICSNTNHLIQSEFYISATVTNSCQCTQQNVRKILENRLKNTLSGVRHSEKNCEAAEEEYYPGEIELENEGSNDNWRFT